ncbi:hypothetical protein [Trichormus variabilis]|uniref:hypothetical protein n=1 Tax=Anabaena variabilis TaxID=264691 RepID=UPI0016836EAE|nr:hypothetical protein [Trichormus variabilis]MBD2628475.1 hypothetical protein [Trichormus variabilis FACHB-164]
MESSSRPDYVTRFKGEGIGTKYKQPSITVRFPEQADQILRSLPNMSDYVRRAVIKQLIADGLLDENSQPVNPE